MINQIDKDKLDVSNLFFDKELIQMDNCIIIGNEGGY